ncbi:ribonuclease H-like domain-containing protein [Tanacetum coccineum]
MKCLGLTDEVSPKSKDMHMPLRDNKLDVSNPLHLHPNDSATLTVISVKLKGTDNYQVWSCDMLLALEGKNKISIIDGTYRRSNIDEVLGRQCDRVNAMEELKETYDKVDKSVTFSLDHKIHSFSQNGSSIADYYHSEQSVQELNYLNFFNSDYPDDHPDIPNDEERSDPNPTRYGTPSPHSGSTFKPLHENEGEHSQGPNAAATEDEMSTNHEDDQKNNIFLRPWVDAMNSEMDALYRNNTWKLADLPKGRKAIGSKWVFESNISLMGKLRDTKLDVNNAFLYGDLNETICMSLPSGYFSANETKVCKLNKSLYGLKQAPRQWNAKLTTALIENNFVQIVGEIENFLGIEVLETLSGICLNQRKYCLELIDKFGLLASKPFYIPMQPNISLSSEPKDDDPLLDNITEYEKLIGKLIYLTTTRPDNAYTVCCLSQFMHSPLRSHLKTAIKVIRYLKGSPGKGINLIKRFASSIDLKAYTDADCSRCTNTRRLSTVLNISAADELKRKYVPKVAGSGSWLKKRFSGNAATSKTKRKSLLKQQYEHFNAPSQKMLDQTFDRLQTLVSQLELFGRKAFIRKFSTASTQVNAANSTNIDNLSDVVICAFFASQPNSPQLVNEDLKQIYPYDIEEMDLRWQMTMLMAMRLLVLIRKAQEGRVPGGYIYFSTLESCDGLGGYDWNDQAEEGPNYALMAFSSSSLDSEVSNDSIYEFVNKPVVENCKAMSSEEEPKIVRKNDDASMNAARPMSYLSKIAHSTVKRPINNNTTFKNSNINQRVNTVRGKNVNTARPKAVVNVVQGNNVNAVKALACWGNPQMDLQDKGVIDSGCSRHMIGNMSYLPDYEEIDGGYIAFGGNPKGGKITRKAVNTACYVQNRVLVVKPHNKTPYEFFHGRTPTLSFMRPFGCLVTILNTIDHLGKFDGKADEGFFVGYSLNSKAVRVFNSRTRIVEKNLHIRFSKSTPNVVGSGPDWLFDIDALTRTMDYEPIVVGTQYNGFAGTKANDNAGQARKETEPVKDYIFLSLWTAEPPYSQDPNSSHDDRSKPSSNDEKKVDEDPRKESECNGHEKEDNVNSTNNVNTAGTNEVNAVGGKTIIELSFDLNMHALEDYSIFDFLRCKTPYLRSLLFPVS